MNFIRSNLIAVLALFVALGGTSYAAIALPKNSVGTKQIKKSAVTTAKVKNGSLLAADFRAGQLPAGATGPAGAAGAKGDKGDTGATGAQGAQGVQGVQGEQGEQGIQGERGPSNALSSSVATGPTNLSQAGDTLVSVIMSTGAWVANAKVVLNNDGAATAVDCILFTSGNAGSPIDKATIDLGADAGMDQAEIVLQGVHPTGGNFLIVNCDDNTGTVAATDIKLQAIQVGDLD